MVFCCVDKSGRSSRGLEQDHNGSYQQRHGNLPNHLGLADHSSMGRSYLLADGEKVDPGGWEMP